MGSDRHPACCKESIFSGLNNLKINSTLDERYSEYFGFTSDEVREMAEYYSASDKYQELCDWYDGYRFGNTEILIPGLSSGTSTTTAVPKHFGSPPEAMTSSVRCWLLQHRILWSVWSC